MALVDTTTNLNAVLNKLTCQIDQRIGVLEDELEQTYKCELLDPDKEDDVKFLKHIRLVLAGPIDASPTPTNVRAITKNHKPNQTKHYSSETAHDLASSVNVNPSG